MMKHIKYFKIFESNDFIHEYDVIDDRIESICLDLDLYNLENQRVNVEVVKSVFENNYNGFISIFEDIGNRVNGMNSDLQIQFLIKKDFYDENQQDIERSVEFIKDMNYTSAKD